MQSTPNLDQFIPEELTRIAYQGFQESKKAFGFLHKQISDRLTNTIVPEQATKSKPLSPEVFEKLQVRLKSLEEKDWQDAQNGVYPSSLLFDNPWSDFFRYYPELCLDMVKIWDRLQKKEFQKFDNAIDRTGYPDYYLQNFHYQTDGYLSDMSANLYDLQVEILFNGAADAMRRRILAPLKQGLQAFASLPPQQIKVLDIACGTGRTLRMIRGTLPQVALFGTDLSPAYLRKANQVLSEIPGELPQLLQTNAESLPYQDNYFHGLTSVFLFHELPASARQAVINEAFRVLQPGGVLAICDSIQATDSPDFQEMMNNFPSIFHEPYYRHYTTDSLEERLRQAGFINLQVENHFVSKYWTAYKPVV
ncbi:class I SAM-dependent methyltransferase [Waterburya agarophytonicola K14]|uniref:Class I SAM-dependent methyltransferase n=1 Tax=Waterburya agarophytonicola KI4 TaxID=2874699 RepID=A0A964BS84_9CYAN|nr:class I SAM-dependent methyltransferase [Waterburya agarophytonicola]MCC0177257.1 class I SAM-dependent methyltransferase [Waterburya agarophytonicola KI4]